MRGHCEGAQALDGDGGVDLLDVGDCALGIASGLITDRGQLGYAILERGIAHIDHAVFDGLVQPLELGFGLGGPALQIGDVQPALADPFVAAFQQRVHHHLEPGRIEQARL